MKKVLKLLCDFANIVYQAWNWSGCWLCKEIVRPIVVAMIDILRPVLSMFRPAGEGIISFLVFIERLIDGFTCNESLPCKILPKNESFRPLGTLPVASRCWADYSPEVDESDSFACTRYEPCSNGVIEISSTVDLA